MPRQNSAEAALLLAVLLWSLNFAGSKYGVSATSPLGFAIVRFALGAAVAVAAMLIMVGAPRFRRQDLGLLVAAALCGVSVNQVAFVGALSVMSASNVALLVYTIPIWTTVLAIAARQERLDAAHVIGLALGLAGVALIVAGGSDPGIGAMTLPGVALALTTAVSWAVYSVLIRPLMARYSPLQISAFTMVGGTLVLVPFGLPDLAGQDWGAVPTEAWLAMAYTGIAATAFTNILYFRAVHRVGASRAALYGYLTPFLAVLFAVLLLGDRVAVLQIGGGILVVAAVLVGRRRQSAMLESAT